MADAFVVTRRVAGQSHGIDAGSGRRVLSFWHDGNGAKVLLIAFEDRAAAMNFAATIRGTAYRNLDEAHVAFEELVGDGSG